MIRGAQGWLYRQGKQKTLRHACADPLTAVQKKEKDPGFLKYFSVRAAFAITTSFLLRRAAPPVSTCLLQLQLQ